MKENKYEIEVIFNENGVSFQELVEKILVNKILSKDFEDEL